MSRAKASVAPSEQPAWAAALGQRLRDIRQERRLSLSHVSKATGISTSFLSLLEKGQTDISLGRLLPLLEFYGLSAADVLAWGEDDDDPSAMVVRAGEAPLLLSAAKGVNLFLAAPDRHRPFLPVIAEYEPGARVRTYSTHPGDEFMFVLEGALRVEFRGAEPVVLSPGDAVFFPSQRPHRISTDGDGGARALIVTTERISP